MRLTLLSPYAPAAGDDDEGGAAAVGGADWQEGVRGHRRQAERHVPLHREDGLGAEPARLLPVSVGPAP